MRKKVLVVDDSLLLHRMFEIAFTSYKASEIDVLFAESGKDGLIRLHEHPDTDLIFLDINMATMSGLEFLSRVKSEQAFRGIDVVLQTTEDASRDVERGLEAGAKDYLPKPFTPEQLHAMLDEMFFGARASDSIDVQPNGSDR